MRKNTAAVLACATALALTLGACGGSEPVADQAAPDQPASDQVVSDQTTSDQAPAVTKTAPSGSINSEEALAIALLNAGLQESEVTVEEVGSDNEDGVNIFDVKFYTNTMDYEYNVDATTGEILFSDIEYRD